MNKFGTKYLPYFPIFGLGLYVIVFYFAAAAYPGGSVNYPNANGYSFSHNFLCDALNPITERGSVNNARFMAVISHLILSLSMISFFYVLPKVFKVKNRNTLVIASFGIASMTALMFMMFTTYHDLMVLFTGILGTIAMIPLFIELQDFENKGLKRLMYFCFSLSIIVFLSFQTKIGFYYLPFLQKITFAVDAWWVIWSCLFVINKNKLEARRIEFRD